MKSDARHPPPDWRYEVFVTRSEEGGWIVRVEGRRSGDAHVFSTLLRAFEFIERDVDAAASERGVR
ncbi:hypothetical protein [Deinococcus yavapaiensis]|uniref:Uncharacterized protein n=1 Tax=Deinococcus yavapaiensis KR-236 TaxID=694435 RepID=A0A318S7G4_9DEIO|nr:hypothetical protein [Deinococcus yavapaiensis]PYE54856.1 hypothetical protein DES52_104127 [Deinococcus yavapaiensis KR-236]